jgi:hypothetical protein
MKLMAQNTCTEQVACNDFIFRNLFRTKLMAESSKSMNWHRTQNPVRISRLIRTTRLLSIVQRVNLESNLAVSQSIMNNSSFNSRETVKRD